MIHYNMHMYLLNCWTYNRSMNPDLDNCYNQDHNNHMMTHQTMLILIGLHLIFQQFDLNYLIPRIIGRRVHLPPLVVILGVVIGAALAGVLGVVLAAPTIASARILGRYVYANLFDLDPFPGEIAPPLPPPDPNWWRLRGRQESRSR